MTTISMDVSAVEALAAQVRGEIVRPGDPSYDEARAVHNAMHDRRPGLIVRAVDVADVVAVVNFAREQGVDLAVRAGGHSAPGFGTVDDGVVLDLSGIRNVRVDPDARTARVGGGALWGDLDHATHAYGLATTGGIISTTGVAGLTLGGGIGHLARGCGLSLDNLLSADVVLADGSIVTASEKSNPDLFWALRGGGGNFGVVTSFEFRLHPVSMVLAGPIVWDLDDAETAMKFWRGFIEDAPEQLGCFFGFHVAPPLPFLPEERHFTNVALAACCWTGDPDEGRKVIKPLLDVAPIVGEHLDVVPYPAFNSAFDGLVPPGKLAYWKASFATGFSDDAVTAHLEHGAKVPTVNSAVHLYPINGAPKRVASADTAFAHRDASFSPVYLAMWDDPADSEANRAWVRGYFDAVKPFSLEGGYINFMDADDGDRIEANYTDNYRRLVEVKTKYDPDNVFHINQNIAPQR